VSRAVAGSEAVPGGAEPVRAIPPPRRPAILFLLGGTALAAGVPLLLGYTSGRLNTITLRSPELALWQLIPYVLCGALWLPWRGAFARKAARKVAAVLFGVSALIYLPMLVHPEWLSGDMVGLAFMIVTLTVSAGVVLLTLGIWLVRVWRHRAGSSGGPAGADAIRR